MLSNTLELGGLTALVAGSYELAGRGWALLVLAGCLMFLGVAADGLHPVRLVRVPSSDLKTRLFRRLHSKSKGSGTI